MGISVAWGLAPGALLSRMRGDAALQELYGNGTTYAYQTLAYAARLPSETGEARARTATRLREVVAANSQRYQRLLDGDPTKGLDPVTDPILRTGLAERA